MGAPPPQSPAGAALTELILLVFRLNGRLLEAAERMAAAGGLTAARWQVLGAVLRGPLTVSGIARAMGMTRQGVQRIADLVVEQGLAEYVDNPAHRRSKLVRVTDEGVAAIRRIDPGHAAMAERLRKEMGRQRLEQALDALHDLSAAFDRLEAQDAAASG